MIGRTAPCFALRVLAWLVLGPIAVAGAAAFVIAFTIALLRQ